LHTYNIAVYYKEKEPMFLVFNKQKIISYIVAFSTVAVLLFGANVFYKNEEESIQTSANTTIQTPSNFEDTNDTENNIVN
jgi:hypothetical protein